MFPVQVVDSLVSFLQAQAWAFSDYESGEPPNDDPPVYWPIVRLRILSAAKKSA